MAAAFLTSLVSLLLYVAFLLALRDGRFEAFAAKPICTGIAFIALASFVLILFLNYLLIYQFHDWDIDAYLYLGSRLDDGELLFTRDFETKFPIVQYLFWLPYKLGGIGAWRVITFGVTVATAFLAARSFSITLFEASSHSKPRTTTIAGFTACVYILLLYALPGADAAHISIVAADCMFLGVALYAEALLRRNYNMLLLAGAGFLIGLAVSIRPHYGFTVPGLLLSCALIKTELPLGRRAALSFKAFAAFAIFLVLTFAAQFVPYLTGSAAPRALLDVPRLFSQFSSGTPLSDIVSDQFSHPETLPFIVLTCFSTVFGLALLATKYASHGHEPAYRKSLYISSVSILSTLALFFAFVRTHYYPHYNIMFAPYITLMLVGITSLTALPGDDERENEDVAFLKHTRPHFSVLSLCLAMMFAPFAWTKASDFWSANKNVDYAINDRGFDPSMTALLRNILAANLKFYLPDDIGYHWLLNQPRIGDGHPAMLHTVLTGSRTGPLDGLDLYSDSVYRNPCSAFSNIDKDIILVRRPSSDVLGCLISLNSRYAQLSAETVSRRFSASLSPFMLNEYLFFAKNP